MSARSNKGSEKRAFCPVASRDGRRCDFAEHPGAVHWSWVEGELQFWQALPEPGEVWRNLPATEDPLRDAPQFLIETDAARKVRRVDIPENFDPLANIYKDPTLTRRILRGISASGFFVDEMAHVAEQAKESKVSNSIQDLLARGRQPKVWDRPLVEATSADGHFTYGLLETTAHDTHWVHETMPESGGVPHRVLVRADGIREVLVPGHRGGCAGDCCREGYSEETSYPECWAWDQVRDGTAEKYRAWKDWVL